MTTTPITSNDTEQDWRPATPSKLADTGLPSEFVLELLLKTLYVHGARSGQYLTDFIRLPFPFLDDQLLDLQQRRLVEVRGTQGTNRGGYVFDLTAAGRDRAREALAGSQYIGPAPVPLAQYRDAVLRQSISNVHVTQESLRSGFGHLVLDPELLTTLGPAVNSAKSLFLFGDSGNGKTAIAEAISHLLGGAMYVPYAVEVGGEIMVLHDPVFHRTASDDTEADDALADLWLDGGSTFDRRYVRIERPVVLVGGELTLEQLDLQYDSYTKLYQAPFQVKANGGVLIIDDFGRQRVPPRDLLNRWIVPLERRGDYLTLHTGGKFPAPFDCLVIFATNLDPTHLVEEAFLRRIHYKIHVEDPSRAQYEAIFRACCEARSIPFRAEAVEFVYQQFYRRLSIMPRACHPRDITDHVLDIAKFLAREPQLSTELLERACHSYFLDTTA
jgi:predicted ATPase with chaperone activity